jgi:hypothetical protein
MRIKIIILLLITLVLPGCGPSQKVIGFWADPEAASKGPYKKVFVIILSPNQDANFVIESEMGNLLVSRGYKVVLCNDMFPPNVSFTKNFTREQFKDAISKTGCDAVLTLALLDTKTVESYHPGSAYYPMNYGFYGSYYGYYDYYYPIVYTPGYYSVDRTFYLETNAYDLASDKMLWSLQSEARNPSDLDELFKNYSALVIRHLEGKGLARK